MALDEELTPEYPFSGLLPSAALRKSLRLMATHSLEIESNFNDPREAHSRFCLAAHPPELISLKEVT